MTNYDYTADKKIGKIDRSNFDANSQFLERTGLLKEGIRILESGCGLNAHSFAFTFVNIPIIYDFFDQKIPNVIGSSGVYLLKIVNPDKLPKSLRTKNYVCVEKK